MTAYRWGRAFAWPHRGEKKATQHAAQHGSERPKWSRNDCENFPIVKGWDNKGETKRLFSRWRRTPASTSSSCYGINKLHARSVTVGPHGKIDNGIASANKLRHGWPRDCARHDHGDQDGQWYRAAWKTEAFYATR